MPNYVDLDILIDWLFVFSKIPAAAGGSGQALWPRAGPGRVRHHAGGHQQARKTTAVSEVKNVRLQKVFHRDFVVIILIFPTWFWTKGEVKNLSSYKVTICICKDFKNNLMWFFLHLSERCVSGDHRTRQILESIDKQEWILTNIVTSFGPGTYTINSFLKTI